jgi:hypothetical protein
MQVVRLVCAVLVMVMCESACDRGRPLTGRYGELVVVVPGALESLTREATVTAPDAVMGETSNASIVLRNIGEGAATLSQVTVVEGSPAFAIEASGQLQLSPQEETVLAVTFSPSQASDVSLTSVAHASVFQLDATGTRPDESTATVRLTATAHARDCYVPPVLDFGEVPIGQAIELPLSLANATSVATVASASAPTGDDALFFSLRSEPTVMLGPGESAAARIRFTPQSERLHQAGLVVRRRTSCPEGTPRLVGIGSSQSFEWSPKELVFGRVPLNDTAQRTVAVFNRSGADLTLRGSIDGVGFSLSAPVATLPARGRATLQVSCTPTEFGPMNGTLRVDIETVPTFPFRLPLRCSGGGPRARLSPASVAFGSVPFQIDPISKQPLAMIQQTQVLRRLRLENVGTPPSQSGDREFNLFLGRDRQPPFFSIVAKGGTRPDEFRVSLGRYDPDAGLPALVGQNAVDVEIAVQPAVVGVREATLLVYSNDAVTPTHQIPLSATATTTAPCTLDVFPAVLNWPEMPPDHRANATLSLRNAGLSPCLVSSLEIGAGSSPGFSLPNATGSSVVIGPGQAFVLPISFDSTGLMTGTTAEGVLRFSAAGTTEGRVPLMATVSQCLVVAPEELDFGSIKLGCRSTARQAQVFNTCGTPVVVRSFALSDASAFALVTAPALPPSGLSVAPSTGVPVTLSFKPTSLGRATSTLVARVGEGGSMRTLVLGLVGRGDPTGSNVETFQQPAQPKSDILFTVDDSCSMAEEQAALAQNFSSFIRFATAGNVDYRIAVTTTDDRSRAGRFVTAPGEPVFLERSVVNVQSLFAKRVNVGTNGSGEERPLATTLKALTPPLSVTSNAGFLRPDANLAVIIVTDAPDQSPEPIAYYTTRMPLVKGAGRLNQVSVSVIGPFSATTSTCAVETIDVGRFQPIVQTTGGVRADICANEWARDLERLGTTAFGPRNTFFIKNPPDRQQPIEVLVNGQSVANAWTYDAANNAIVFAPGQAPAAGTTVTLTYASLCL